MKRSKVKKEFDPLTQTGSVTFPLGDDEAFEEAMAVLRKELGWDGSKEDLGEEGE